jgi:hypothetical protein
LQSPLDFLREQSPPELSAPECSQGTILAALPHIPANRLALVAKFHPAWNKIKLYPRQLLPKKGSGHPATGFAEVSHLAMAQDPKSRRPIATTRRAVIEVAFIIFLFYSNLLMGEFNRTNGAGKTFAAALYDIFTIKNLAIAIIAASIGYVVFEHLRKKP